MTTLTPDHLLDLIARAHRVTGIAVDDIGDGGMSLLRWLAEQRLVSVWAEQDLAWHVEVGGVAYEGPTLLLATLRAVAGL